MKQVFDSPENLQAAEIAAGTIRLMVCFGVICLFIVAASG